MHLPVSDRAQQARRRPRLDGQGDGRARHA